MLIKNKMKKAIGLAMIMMCWACQKTEVSTSTSTGTSVTPTKTYSGTGSITQGIGTTVVGSLYTCTGGRVSAVGNILSTDAKSWVLPAENSFSSANKLPDLFNECNAKSPSSMAQVDTAKIPTTIIDSDGEIITGFIYGDNYFELYVNGKLVGVDAVPFTPFNSSFVKFKAKRPIKYAIKLVDWEENLGLGTELNGGDANHPGDGGFIAKFSDGTVTNASWKAQTFFIGPLHDPKEVVEKGNIHDTPNLGGRTHPFSRKPTCEFKCYAVHYPIPKNWQSSRFNDTNWPRAWEFTDQEIGVNNLQAYTRFPELFQDARWIWTQNLVLDNVVIARKTVK